MNGGRQNSHQAVRVGNAKTERTEEITSRIRPSRLVRGVGASNAPRKKPPVGHLVATLPPEPPRQLPAPTSIQL
jgi:hypothetical protein